MKKIFISYGHNDHIELVDAVCKDLKAKGHNVWKDDDFETGGVKAGDDFVEVIYKAIREYDFVVAFVSAATKERLFCRDERNYAYNFKEHCFIQIRLDGTEICLGNSRSYIDMTDVEGSDGKINKALFEKKMLSLYAALDDPESFSKGGFVHWAKFEAHLKVAGALKYEDFITVPEREEFVGREWLCEKCRSWVMDDSIACRVFVILGDAGTGKTAFVRHLAADRSLVRSVHVCIYDRPATRTARDTLKDLAYILAGNNKAYYDFLKDKNFRDIKDMSIDGMFEFLFLDPLKNEKEKYLIIIDGLDELDEDNGFNPLVKLFRQFSQKINPNVSFLLTGRPDENITSKLRTISTSKPIEKVILDRENGNEDLNRYIMTKFDELGYSSEVLCDRLLEACDGNFEYLSLLFKEVKDEGLVLSEDMKIPRGLYERYTQYIDRRMETFGQGTCFSESQSLLLSVISVAFEPLPRPLLASFAKMSDFRTRDELNIFGSLIKKNIDKNNIPYISFFAKGLRDYLLEKAFDNYSADFDEGTRAVADFMFRNCRRERDFIKYPYLDRNGFRHLFIYAEKEPYEVKEFIDKFWEENYDAVSLRIAVAISQGNGKTAEVFCEMYANDYGRYRHVVNRLKERRKKEALFEIADALDDIGMEEKALVLRGDIALMEPLPKMQKKAEELYHSSREISERKYARSPGYDTRENLSIAYYRLGNIARTKGTLEGIIEAEKWYAKVYELEKLNYQERTCYETTRAFAYICRRIGDSKKLKNRPEFISEVEQWYEEARKFDEINDIDNPCYESRSNLASDYERLGNISSEKNTTEALAEAEKWYRKEKELLEGNCEDNPCYDSRKLLAAACALLGEVNGRKNTPEATSEAFELYEREKELFDINYKENQCYESRRNLALSCVRLGDMIRGKDISAAENLYREACNLLKINYDEEPCCDGMQNLINAYRKLGDILKGRSAPEDIKEAEYCRRECAALEENLNADV